MDVITALKNSKKGKLKYDRYWSEEGRTQEILDEISANLTCLTISPKALSLVIEQSSPNSSVEKQKEADFVSKNDITEKKVTPLHNENIDLHLFRMQSEHEIPILEYEEERLKAVQELFEAKKLEFEIHSQELQQQIEEQYEIFKKKKELDAKRRDAELQQIAEMCLKEAKEKEKHLNEQYQMHTKTLSVKVREAELKQRQEEEKELQRKAKEQEDRKCLLYAYQKDLHDFVSKHLEQLNSADIQKYLHVPYKECISELTTFLQNLDNKVKESVTENGPIENLNKFGCIDEVQHVLTDIMQAKQKAVQELKKELQKSKSDDSLYQNKVFASEQSEKSALINKKETPSGSPQKLPLTSVLQSGDSASINKNITSPAKSESMELAVDKPVSDEMKLLSLCVDTDVFREYREIMKNFKKIEASYKSFTSDVQKKKYRFELQKAVTVSINTINNISGYDVKEKMQKLLSLLSGHSVQVSGKLVSCQQDSLTLNFCKYLVAKKLVDQAESQIESNVIAAFPIAAAILGICSKFNDIWPLVLGHLYTKCPYLVPFYPPRQEGQSDEEYFKCLGYEFPDGKMEDKNTFLKRMKGYVILYAAMIQSTPPPGYPSFPHCGIHLGWKWLACVLNIDPRPDITPTVLMNFLSTAGYALQKAYGKQFKKILHVLCKEYFTKIKKIMTTGSFGPVSRLEDFLQSCIKQGNILPPEGLLRANFWRT